MISCETRGFGLGFGTGGRLDERVTCMTREPCLARTCDSTVSRSSQSKGEGQRGRGAGTLRLALNANPPIREEITLLINRIAEKLGDLVEPLHTHCLKVC